MKAEDFLFCSRNNKDQLNFYEPFNLVIVLLEDFLMVFKYIYDFLGLCWHMSNEFHIGNYFRATYTCCVQ